MNAELLAMPLTGHLPVAPRPAEPQVRAPAGTDPSSAAGTDKGAATGTGGGTGTGTSTVGAAATARLQAAADRAGSAFPPLLLLACAVVVWFGFQSVQLATQYRQLGQAEAGLQVQTQAAARVRAALDAVASATAKLAGDGNPNARAVVEELRRRGVTIDPSKALQKP